MAKKEKTKPADKKGRTMVWHIWHFEQRFEMPEDFRKCRVGPLIYLKEYVGTGADDEQITYRQQMALIRQRPDRHLLRSVFIELRELAACRSRAYRGYLLDDRLRPASNGWLAALCGLDSRTMQRCLKALASIGLVVQTPLPQWDLSKNKDPESPAAEKPKPAQKGPKNAKKRNPRKRPEKNGKNRRPLNIVKVKDKVKDKEKDKKKEIGIRQRKSEEKKKKTSDSIKDNPKTEIETETEGKANAQASRQGQPTAVPPPPPAAQSPKPKSKPTDPSQSDAGEAVSCTQEPPPPSINLSAMLNDLYNPELFADAVFQRLFGGPPCGLHGRQEIGAYASAWERALQASLKPSELKRLWDRSLLRAEQISRKRRRVKSPGAVWMHEFNKRLHACGPPVSQVI